MTKQQAEWGSRSGSHRRRRGFILAASLGLIVAILAGAVIAQTVALSDLRFASRALLKTQAYLNARSGIAVALNRLKEQPELRTVESGSGVEMPQGTFQVDISPEVASAFGDLLAPLPADSPVYLVESVGRIPIRAGGTFNVKLTAVVRLEEERLQIVLWSENPGAAVRPGL